MIYSRTTSNKSALAAFAITVAFVFGISCQRETSRPKSEPQFKIGEMVGYNLDSTVVGYITKIECDEHDCRYLLHYLNQKNGEFYETWAKVFELERVGQK